MDLPYVWAALSGDKMGLIIFAATEQLAHATLFHLFERVLRAIEVSNFTVGP